jgi:hypothetical protein
MKEDFELQIAATCIQLEKAYDQLGELIQKIAAITPADIANLPKEKKASMLRKLELYRRDASPKRTSSKDSKKKAAEKKPETAKKEEPVHKPLNPRHASIFMGKDKSFAEFFNEHKYSMGESYARKNRYVAMLYKHLPEDAKAFYQLLADKDKARYKNEMEHKGEWTEEDIKKSRAKDLTNQAIEIPKGMNIFKAALSASIAEVKGQPAPEAPPKKSKLAKKLKTPSQSKSNSVVASSSDG